MKFDIVRAWKDEAYRLSLSDEQRNMLPANPAGLELADADLDAIYGAGEGGDSHKSSLAVVACELNVFTLNVNVLAVPINLLNGATHNCEQNH